MTINYQDTLVKILNDEANEISVDLKQIGFLDTCSWGVVFGSELHDEILCVVDEVLDENKLSLEGYKFDTYWK